MSPITCCLARGRSGIRVSNARRGQLRPPRPAAGRGSLSCGKKPPPLAAADAVVGEARSTPPRSWRSFAPAPKPTCTIPPGYRIQRGFSPVGDAVASVRSRSYSVEYTLWSREHMRAGGRSFAFEAPREYAGLRGQWIQRKTAEEGGRRLHTCPLECWLGDKSASSPSRAPKPEGAPPAPGMTLVGRASERRPSSAGVSRREACAGRGGARRRGMGWAGRGGDLG